MMKILNYINGELKDPIGNSWIDNYEPATGEIYSQIADSDLRDVELAVAAAENAFDGWCNTLAEERAKILLRIADIIDSKLDFL
ncbi:MAG: aldehyde dehydrogenase family protein, partial [Bacteroidota bacterium]